MRNITANNNIENDIQGVHDAILPDLTSLEGCLKDYTDYLILNPATNGNNQQVHNPANIMATYMLLENYFTTLVNYQLQGLTILSNVYNYVDTTGATVELYIDDTFGPLISDEINTYLQTVNYLVLNLFDHRSVNQYVYDMKYRDYGMAPDSVCYNILARANFVGNLYLVMVNVQPSSICGNIMIPSKYTGGITPPVSSLLINYSSSGSGSQAANALPLQSTYPYTYWQKTGNTWQAAPDNTYNLFTYQFDTAYHPGSQRITLNIGNLSGNKSPWYYQLPPTGYVDARYYNPRNPSYETSTTQRTDSNTMLFGFFSSKWIWGWQMLSMGNASDWSLTNFSTGSHTWNCFEGNILCPPNPLLTDTYGNSAPNPGQTWFLTNQSPSTLFVHSVNFQIPQQIQGSISIPVACSSYEINVVLNPVTNGLVNFYSTITGTNPGIYNCGNSWVSFYPKQLIGDNIFGFNNQYPYGFGGSPISASGMKAVSVNAGQPFSLLIDCEMAFPDKSKTSASLDWNMQPMFNNTYNIFN